MKQEMRELLFRVGSFFLFYSVNIFFWVLLVILDYGQFIWTGVLLFFNSNIPLVLTALLTLGISTAVTIMVFKRWLPTIWERVVRSFLMRR